MGKFKNNKIFEWLMNKREEILVISIAIGIIILTTIGVYMVYDASNNLYVGNKETGEYLNYFQCESVVKNISDDNLIIFKSKQHAINLNYNLSVECGKKGV